MSLIKIPHQITVRFQSNTNSRTILPIVESCPVQAKEVGGPGCRGSREEHGKESDQVTDRDELLLVGKELNFMHTFDEHRIICLGCQ